MATKSFLKEIVIKDKKATESFINALFFAKNYKCQLTLLGENYSYGD